MEWKNTLATARKSLAVLDESLTNLRALGDSATAEIAQYLRVDNSLEIDIDAIKETLKRPYTILPINEHEAHLIHWRGVQMPILGWVVKSDGAFIVSRISRSMDLVSPLPAWMKNELGWKPPAHAAVIGGDRATIRVTAGDEASFRKRYGAHLGAKQADGEIKIKSGDAWIKLVSNLVRDGILPYQPTPVASEHWNAQATTEIELRDYQLPAVEAFREKGASLVNFPPGSGKSFIVLYILAHFVGRVLLLADSTILCEQWHARLKKFAPKAQVIVSTYQGAAKYLKNEFDLLLCDEAQRVPAATFSRLAFIKTKYRLGATATPWREDSRVFLITALSGFPIAVSWAKLIAQGILRKPRVVVATVPNANQKANYVKHLLSKRKGRAIIFCDWIEEGQALASALQVPFIYGSSTNKLQQLETAEVCVISRIGDRGLDLPDLSLVIEVASLGASREQYAQRLGRLLHSQFNGEFHTVFDPQEAEKYRPRIFGAEAEMAGEVEIEFISWPNAGQQVERTTARPAKRSSQPKTKPMAVQDETDRLLALPSIRAKIKAARDSISDSQARGHVESILRLLSKIPSATPATIAEGKGLSSERSINRYAAACEALAQVGLVEAVGKNSDRYKQEYRLNRGEIERLKGLATSIGKG